MEGKPLLNKLKQTQLCIYCLTPKAKSSSVNLLYLLYADYPKINKIVPSSISPCVWDGDACFCFKNFFKSKKTPKKYKPELMVYFQKCIAKWTDTMEAKI